MNAKNFTVISDYDALPLKGSVYEPKGKPKGIVQVAHGMCEFKEKYYDFLEYFAKNGYIAAAHDHRGHGESVRSQEDFGWFNDKTGVAIVHDTLLVTKYLKTQYPDLPVYLFGHSMGSMVVRNYIQEYDTEIDKLIVCGSPSKNPLVDGGIAMAKSISFVKGERHRSNTLHNLATGKNDEKFPGEGPGAWITQDKEYITKFFGDPKYSFTFTCNGFENLFRLMKKTYDKKLYKVQNPDLPILFVSGSDDVVMGDENKWIASQQLLRDIGYKNVAGKLYHGYRHEIHNEIGKEKPLADMLAFLEK